MKKKDITNYYIKLIQIKAIILLTIKSYIRILKMSKKPTKSEYISTITVSSVGILFIGIIGFFFYLIMDIIPKMV